MQTGHNFFLVPPTAKPLDQKFPNLLVPTLEQTAPNTPTCDEFQSWNTLAQQWLKLSELLGNPTGRNVFVVWPLQKGFPYQTRCSMPSHTIDFFRFRPPGHAATGPAGQPGHRRPRDPRPATASHRQPRPAPASPATRPRGQPTIPRPVARMFGVAPRHLRKPLFFCCCCAKLR